jgi:phospholipid/cholesterol/gamma-HCH transport system substrate-binding protein
MRSKIIQLLVFAAVCIGLTFYIGAKIQGFSRTSSYGLSATFSNVSGLGAGDPVRLAGVPVGKVTSVRLVLGTADVHMRVNDSVKVPVDSSVAVRWRNLIGQRYLAIVPGQSPQMLNRGAVITKTTAVVDLGSLVNRLGSLIGEISPQQLNTIFTTLDQALNGNVGNTETLVSDLNDLLGTLASRNQTLSQLLTDYKTITGTLATRDKEIEAMVDNLALLSGAFADNTQLVGSAVDQLSGLSTGLDQLLTTSGAHVSGVVNNLAVLTGVLRARINDLQDTLHNLPTALQALFSVSAQGEFVAVDAICLSVTPTCNYPIILAPPTASSASTGGIPLDSAAAFKSFLLGSP